MIESRRKIVPLLLLRNYFILCGNKLHYPSLVYVTSTNLYNKAIFYFISIGNALLLKKIFSLFLDVLVLHIANKLLDHFR